MLSKFSAVVLSNLALLFFPSAGAITASVREPTSALGLASLLASKRLGCTDFLSETLIPSPRPGITLPAQLQQLIDILNDASTGSCTLAHHDTLLVVFASRQARATFETDLNAAGCILASMIGLDLPATTGPIPSNRPAAANVPIVEIGNRSLLFSTGTTTTSGTQPLNLTRATATARRIAKTTNGKVKTVPLQCT
jgi:hypothetical protein